MTRNLLGDDDPGSLADIASDAIGETVVAADYLSTTGQEDWANRVLTTGIEGSQALEDYQ